jgi:hypothetical protein
VKLLEVSTLKYCTKITVHLSGNNPPYPLPLALTRGPDPTMALSAAQFSAMAMRPQMPMVASLHVSKSGHSTATTTSVSPKKEQSSSKHGSSESAGTQARSGADKNVAGSSNTSNAGHKTNSQGSGKRKKDKSSDKCVGTPQNRKPKPGKQAADSSAVVAAASSSAAGGEAKNQTGSQAGGQVQGLCTVGIEPIVMLAGAVISGSSDLREQLLDPHPPVATDNPETRTSADSTSVAATASESTPLPALLVTVNTGNDAAVGRPSDLTQLSTLSDAATLLPKLSPSGKTLKRSKKSSKDAAGGVASETSSAPSVSDVAKPSIPSAILETADALQTPLVSADDGGLIVDNAADVAMETNVSSSVNQCPNAPHECGEDAVDPNVRILKPIMSIDDVVKMRAVTDAGCELHTSSTPLAALSALTETLPATLTETLPPQGALNESLPPPPLVAFTETTLPSVAPLADDFARNQDESMTEQISEEIAACKWHWKGEPVDKLVPTQVS